MKQKSYLVSNNPVLNIEPPPGLSFENLRPCLSFGQGYEAHMLGQGYPHETSSSQGFNCKMRPARGVRVVRFYQQSNARSWSKWKLYLGEFPTLILIPFLLIHLILKFYRWEKATTGREHKWSGPFKVTAWIWHWPQVLWWVHANSLTLSRL